MASANSSSKYLLAIALGPVQDFIASARRNRDLWFGSWLLSEISKAAAHRIHTDGGKLIFPSPSEIESDVEKHLKPSSEFSVVNKILAEVETDNLPGFCKEIGNDMLKRLRAIRDEAFKEVINDKHGRVRKVRNKNSSDVVAIHYDNAVKQIDDLIEYYWAAQPFNNASDYANARRSAESLLAARKATRNFMPVRWGKSVPKSSLDGMRESVIDEAVFKAVKEGTLSEKDARIRFGVRGREHLCGVGLLKRHGNRQSTTRGESDSFFSTSHVAALPLLNRLKEKDLDAVHDFMSELTAALGIGDAKKELGHVPKNATLNSHNFFRSLTDANGNYDLYDGHLLFEERLREFCVEDGETGKVDKTKFESAKEALRKFLSDKEIFSEQLPSSLRKPLPYYAILHADGDRMGVAIDTHATDTRHQAATSESTPDDAKLPESGIEKHRLLSRQLSEFAKRVREIVEIEHSGSCVYAGGDDVLALLPLHTALACARELADDFKIALQKFPDKHGDTPTLSVGLAIGHHLDPLQDTLELARQAEKIAKREVKGKNALAVTVSKRSGSDRTVKGSWNVKLPESALDGRLNRFIYLHLKDELPDGAAYEIQDLAIRLIPITDSPDDTLLQAQRAEAKRILKRKQPQRGKEKNLKDDVFDYLSNLITDGKLPLKSLAEEIIVARLFADALLQAGIEADDFAQKNGITLTLTETASPTEQPTLTTTEASNNV